MNCPRCGNGTTKQNGKYLCHTCKIIFHPRDVVIDTEKCEECGTYYFNQTKCDCRLIRCEAS